MKKISLILLAMFLFQGTENCEAGVYKPASRLIPKPDIPHPNEDELAKEAKEKESKEIEDKEKEAAEKAAKEAEEKAAKEAAEKAAKEAAEKAAKEAAEAEEKAAKEAAEAEEKKTGSELEKALSALKIENDAKALVVDSYKNGTGIPKVIEEKISAMDMDTFYKKNQINKVLKKILASERVDSSEAFSDKYQEALKKLGFSKDSKGLEAIRGVKMNYARKLEQLKTKNKAQETLILEAQIFALQNVFNAIKEVVEKGVDIQVLNNVIKDVSVPHTIKDQYESLVAPLPIDELKDAFGKAQVKRTLTPLGLTVQKALEEKTKALDDANKSIQAEEITDQLVGRLEALETYVEDHVKNIQRNTKKFQKRINPLPNLKTKSKNKNKSFATW